MTQRRLALLTTAWLALACTEDVSIRLLEPVPFEDRDAQEPDTQSREPEPELPTPSIEADSASPAPTDSTADDATRDAGMPAPPLPMDSGAFPREPEAGTQPLTPVHHYDFAGEGTIVYDRVGQAHGQLIGGATLDGLGGAVLDGVDDYVELPAALVSSLPRATLVSWIRWNGGNCWQRVFDFGSQVQGSDEETYAETSLFLTPASCRASHIGPVREFVATAQFHVGGSVYLLQEDEPSMPVDEPAFVALVVDPVRGLELTVNGTLVAQLAAPLELSEINDVNSWLGRSQWSYDPTLNARYDEFMIFDVALTEEQLLQLFVETAPEE